MVAVPLTDFQLFLLDLTQPLHGQSRIKRSSFLKNKVGAK